MGAVASGVGRCVEQFPSFERGGRVGNFYVVPVLNDACILAQFGFIQHDLISHAQFGLRLAGKDLAKIPNINWGHAGRGLRLTFEQVNDGRNRLELEWLVGIEV